jgi:hypothetical protein
VIAGEVGTAAMDLVWYRRAGGEDAFLRWESGGDVLGWADASESGQFGKKVERIVTRRQPLERWARTTTNAMHWATGIGRRCRHRVQVLTVGPVVWLSGYVILPSSGVYKPVWECDTRILTNDLSAHLVFGPVPARPTPL